MSNKVKIGSFCKVRRGASPRPIDNPNYFGGDVGWIRISDVTKSFKYLNKTEQYVSPLGESLSVRVDKGDLVMSICGTIGRPIIINIPSCIHDGFVQLYDIKDANKEYLYYILQHHEKDLERKGQPGTQVNLNTTIVENFEIYFPAKPVQSKIARILSTADAVIEKTQAAIAKYKAIKQGMLQDLFTRGIDLKTNKLRPRFDDAPELYKESKLGWIPREWEVERIDTQAKITTGSKDTQNKIEHGVYPFFVRSQTVEKIDSYTYDGEAILTSGDGVGVGKIYHYINGKFDFHQRVYMLYEFEKTISPKFLFYYFSNNFLAVVEKYSAKNTVDSVRMEMIAGMIIPLPPINEQKQISERLNAIDNKLQTEQTYLQKMQSLKKGLMEDLLSGRKCLNLDFQDEQINQDSKTILQSVNLVNQDADNYPVNPKIE